MPHLARDEAGVAFLEHVQSLVWREGDLRRLRHYQRLLLRSCEGCEEDEKNDLPIHVRNLSRQRRHSGFVRSAGGGRADRGGQAGRKPVGRRKAN